MTQIRIRILYRPVTWQKCELEEVPKEFNILAPFFIDKIGATTKHLCTRANSRRHCRLGSGKVRALRP